MSWFRRDMNGFGNRACRGRTSRGYPKRSVGMPDKFFCKWGFPKIMENQMEKKLKNEMETGII